eukprot:CAMPEP_0167765414 /NCGR_PEP_ID=MMETSP0110_2-20121227/14671_1 /TAXON_ID=629695 /ORGANISM="Gymnochlora sp., Strain CCMP2014" /LENGTH=512 /DNA_ID=CAMNT_0007653119 /DNA_START=93 /DNA_END=1631 /DNA_ORIENTATION=-
MQKFVDMEDLLSVRELAGSKSLSRAIPRASKRLEIAIESMTALGKIFTFEENPLMVESRKIQGQLKLVTSAYLQREDGRIGKPVVNNLVFKQIESEIVLLKERDHVFAFKFDFFSKKAGDKVNVVIEFRLPQSNNPDLVCKIGLGALSSSRGRKGKCMREGDLSCPLIYKDATIGCLKVNLAWKITLGDELQFHDEKKSPKEDSSFPVQIMHKHIYSHKDGTRSLDVLLAGYVCGWCSKRYQNIGSLICHLATSHPFIDVAYVRKGENRYDIETRIIPAEGRRIHSLLRKKQIATRVKLTKRKYQRGVHECRFYFHRRKRTLISLVSQLLKERAIGKSCWEADLENISGIFSLSESKDGFEELYESPVKKRKLCAKKEDSTRQYFHSDMTPCEPQDLEYDSDADNNLDETWQLQQTEQIRGEMKEVSYSENIFFRHWNRFMATRHIHGTRMSGFCDIMIPTVCEDFAKSERKWINSNGLRTAFLLHLLSLWEWRLVSTRTIQKCMMMVDFKD